MASHQAGKDLSHQAGQMTGQAQMKKDEYVNQAKETSQSAMDRASGTASDIKGQATNILQQTGEQVKSMAQGAAEAVKNTLGMNNPDDNTIGASNNRPSSNPSNPVSGGTPGNPVSGSNPTRRA